MGEGEAEVVTNAVGEGFILLVPLPLEAGVKDPQEGLNTEGVGELELEVVEEGLALAWAEEVA